jgi:hypothetical protein
MGLLKIFSKSRATVHRLPSGSITVDRHGRVVSTTVSSSYPQALVQNITREVLALFREARDKQIALAELNLHFASLQITARDMRGGAIIFLSPKTESPTALNSN